MQRPRRAHAGPRGHPSRGGPHTLFGTTLAFHIVFATLGVGLPLMIALAEILARRFGDPLYQLMARRWAAFFSVFLGASVASGTIVAVQLQLLWPAFMRLAGQIIAVPFAIEVFAFFIEAVFTAVYVYAGDRIRPGLRIFSALLMTLGAAASALLITDVNAFMNTPTGFHVQNGRLLDVHPWRAMLSPPCRPNSRTCSLPPTSPRPSPSAHSPPLLDCEPRLAERPTTDGENCH